MGVPLPGFSKEKVCPVGILMVERMKTEKPLRGTELQPQSGKWVHTFHPKFQG